MSWHVFDLIAWAYLFCFGFDMGISYCRIAIHLVLVWLTIGFAKAENESRSFEESKISSRHHFWGADKFTCARQDVGAMPSAWVLGRFE